MGATESNIIRALFMWPLQVAAVPDDEAITLGLSLLAITHLPLQLLPIWSRTVLSQLILTNTD